MWALDIESKQVATWQAPGGGIAGSEGPAIGPDGTLYVAELNRVLSFPGAEAAYQNLSIMAKAIVEQGKLIPAEESAASLE